MGNRGGDEGGGGIVVSRREMTPEVGRVGHKGQMGRAQDMSILEMKSEKGRENWWAGKDS
jgi:hypothetical protein